MGLLQEKIGITVKCAILSVLAICGFIFTLGAIYAGITTSVSSVKGQVNKNTDSIHRIEQTLDREISEIKTNISWIKTNLNNGKFYKKSNVM